MPDVIVSDNQSSTATRRVVIAIAILAGLASLAAFGILGIARGGDRNFDGAVLWAAGRTWLSSGNPYDHEQLVRASHGQADLRWIVFFYPPQSAAICVAQGLFQYPVAKTLWLATNLACVVAIILLSWQELEHRTPGESNELGTWILAALILGNPFTTDVVWMGQTSLLAVAATIAAFSFGTGKSTTRRSILAGICLGLASFKPQICALLGIWFLLERQWKIVAAAVITAVALSLPAMMVQGPLGMVRAWQAGIAANYSSLIYNAAGAPHKVGLESLLQSAGLNAPGKLITATGVVLTLCLWAIRRHFDPEDILAILMGLTFVFLGYNHDYDYVGLIPILVSLWIYARSRPKHAWFIVPLLLLLFSPQRYVREAGSPLLDQWRTPVVMALTIAVIVYSIQNRKITPRHADV
jgi:hypothetical protein